MLKKLLGLFSSESTPSSTIEPSYDVLLKEITLTKPKLVYTFSNPKYRFNTRIKVRVDNLEELVTLLKDTNKKISRQDYVGLKDMYYGLSLRNEKEVEMDDFLLDNRRAFYRDNRLLQELEVIREQISVLLHRMENDYDVNIAITRQGALLLKDFWTVFYKPFK